MNQNIKVILVVVALIAFASGISAFKASPCPPGQVAYNYFGRILCSVCPLGDYCPDGEHMYPCPPGTIANIGSVKCEPCVNGTRPDDNAGYCLAADTPYSSKSKVRFDINLAPSSDGLAYFYVVSGFNPGNTVKFDIQPVTGPVTLYMSSTSGAPGPKNFDVMSQGVSPSMTFTKVGKISYFSVKISGPVTLSYVFA